MANIIDFSDALTQEGLLALEYEELEAAATKPENKKYLQELIKLSEQKMKLLQKIISRPDWF